MGWFVPLLPVLFTSLIWNSCLVHGAGAPIVLQQALLAKNSTDTHAIVATFGNPPQTINLIVSTTSSKSWVYAPSFCTSLVKGLTRQFCEASIAVSGGGARDPKARDSTPIYNPQDSSSWKDSGSVFTYDGPNNQQRFVGTVGTDKVVIGGIEIAEFEFGVVTKTDIGKDAAAAAAVVAMAGLDGGIGGVLGLGGDSNFLKYLVDTKAIRSNSIGVQLASRISFTDEENVKNFPARRIIPFGTKDTEFPGNIILGGYDSEKINVDAAQGGGLNGQNEIETNVVKFSSSWFNGANTDNVQHTIEYEAAVGGGSADATANATTGIRAVIDSTSPFIMMPRAFWSVIGQHWNRGTINQTTGRTYYTDSTAYRDWRNFTFDLVNQNGQQSQVIMQHFDWNVWDPETKFWAPAFQLQPEGEDTLVLGRPAIRALYVAVDWDKKEAKTEPLAKRTTEQVKIVEVVSEASARDWAAARVAAVGGMLAMGAAVLL